MNICLLTIGDELLEGIIRNSNAEWLSQTLWARGVSLHEHVTVPDRVEQIADRLILLAQKADICVLSGGLGPTTDDVTVSALATALGEEIVIDQTQQQRLLELGLSLERAQYQARRPQSARSIDNAAGHAPLLSLMLGSCAVIVLPGVPREFKSGVTTQVLPLTVGASSYAAKTLSFLNLGESRLHASVQAAKLDRSIEVRFQASPPYTHLRLRSLDADLLSSVVKHFTVELRQHWVPHTGSALIEALKTALVTTGQTISTAESCTAGMIAAELGRIAGASSYFMGGVVSYSNDAKVNLLNVNRATIAENGAVSEQCAAEMAEGTRAALGTDVGLSVTGVAGPGGGSLEKPVGTVCFGWSVRDRTITETVHFRGKRTSIREASTVWSLNRCLELLSARV